MFFTDHLQTNKLKKLTINLIKSNFFFTMLLKGYNKGKFIMNRTAFFIK